MKYEQLKMILRIITDWGLSEWRTDWRTEVVARTKNIQILDCTSEHTNRIMMMHRCEVPGGQPIRGPDPVCWGVKNHPVSQWEPGLERRGVRSLAPRRMVWVQSGYHSVPLVIIIITSLLLHSGSNVLIVQVLKCKWSLTILNRTKSTTPTSTRPMQLRIIQRDEFIIFCLSWMVSEPLSTNRDLN